MSNLNAARDGIRVVRTMVAERGGLFKRHTPPLPANAQPDLADAQPDYVRSESMSGQRV